MKLHSNWSTLRYSISQDIIYQKDLAETLKRIAKNGRDGFYKGKTADLIVDEMKSNNGLISHIGMARCILSL